MNIMKELTVGDSATWTDMPWLDSASRTLMTSAVWVLTYCIRGPAELTVAATAQSGGWTTSITPAQSAALIPGSYVWSAQLSQTGQRMTIGGGTLKVLPDLSLVTDPMNALTLAEQALAACEAALATFTGQGAKVKKYTIAGRETEFQSISDIMRLRDFWQLKVNNERARTAIRNGRGNPRALLVRFP